MRKDRSANYPVICIAIFIVTLALFAIMIMTLAACAPLGHLGDDTVYDTIWAEPNRLFYNIGESFIPSLDLSVFASYRNFTEEIKLIDVKLSLVVKPDDPDSAVYDIDIIENDFVLIPLLIGKGRKQIIVALRNGNLSTDYLIMVDDPGGILGEEEDEEGGGIGIIWKEPEKPEPPDGGVEPPGDED